MNRKKIFLIILFFLIPLKNSYAESKTVTISESKRSIQLGSYLELLEDRNGKLKIDDILSPEISKQFKPSTSMVPNFGHTMSAQWVRFGLRKSEEFISRTPWILELEFANMHYVDFYITKENGEIVTEKKSGIKRPFDSRDHLYHKIVFMINLRETDKHYVYLRFKSETSLTLSLLLQSMPEFMRRSHFSTFSIGIFIGIILIMAGYNLFMFFTLKDRSLLYFSLFTGAILFYFLSYTGVAYMYFWPSNSWFSYISVPIFMALMVILFTRFTDSFIHAKENLTIWHKVLNQLTLLAIIFLFLIPFLGYGKIIIPLMLFTVICFLLSGFAVFFSWRKGDRASGYYLLGYSGLMAGGFVFSLVRFSLISSTPLSESGLRLGSIMFILSTSLALGERIKVLKAEKKKVATDLQDSEERFRSLVESSYDLIWETDKDSVFTYVSPKVKEILNYEQAEIIGKKPYDLMSAREGKKILAYFRKNLQNNNSIIGLEYIMEKKGGGEVIFDTNVTPFFNKDNETQGYRGINRDITERKRSEKSREIIINIGNAVTRTTDMYSFYKIIHEELNKIIDSKNFFVGIYEEKTETLLLPYIKDEKDKFEKIPIKDTISALVIKDKHPLLLNEEEMKVMENEGKIGKIGSPCKLWLGVPLMVDTEVIGLFVIQSYDDENAYNKFDLSLMEFISGQVAILIKRKQTIEQIRILSMSMEQSPALVVITDLDGKINYVNDKFVKVTGYTPDEIIGKNPRILKSGKTPASTYEDLWSKLSRGEEWRGEFLNKKKDNTFYWEQAYITPIKNDNGDITNFLAIKEDISGRKELEQQLIQSQKMESVGTLAGGIAHDFNNLLTVINGYSDLSLMKIDNNNPLYKSISTIRSAGKKAEKLTRQIMAFSRKQIYQPKVLSINNVISDLDKMIRSLIGEDFKIKVMLSSDLPLIKADPGQIEQILINLLVNSRDAINQKTNKAGEKKITIETGKKYLDEDYIKRHLGSRKGMHIYFSVSDNGMGMDEIVRQNIFEPFFTTKDRNKGTGLGLATVYGIVKQNNGSIYVYSEPGEGTTFKVYWPVTSEEVKKQDSRLSSEKSLYGKEIILFVEDDNEVLEFAVSTLKDFGYNVHSASNGAKALKYIKENKLHADLLITDLVMPDMNGKELSEEITKIYPGINILFASGYTDNHLVHSGELDKEINFLPKPYTAQKLLKVVRMILDLNL
ncbi:MAG: PAS domain S-box protein [Acidobacteriota bacterium]